MARKRGVLSKVIIFLHAISVMQHEPKCIIMSPIFVFARDE